MFTYIINTSENKTFDCDNLIRLVKYNKIQWIYQRLDKIEEVAKEIYERQNTLDAEEFRIVVLIDFFGFDRVKKPYSKADYQIEAGVDVNLYIPFIQTYIFDHLFNYLENKDIWASSWDIYYIQNEKYEHFDLLDNAAEQISKVISPVDGTEGITLPEDFYQDNYIEDKNEYAQLENEIAELKKNIKKAEKDPDRIKEYKILSSELRLKEKALFDLSKKIEKEEKTNRHCYGEYELYCTHNYSLNFNLSNYPYNSFIKSHDTEIEKKDVEAIFEKYLDKAQTEENNDEVNRLTKNKDDELEKIRFEENKKLTLDEFYKAFKDRVNLHKYRVNSHYYVIGYTSSPARSAFDALSLSLYLIRAFEREEETVKLNSFYDDTLDSRFEHDEKPIKLNQKILVDSLVNSWNKINSAREVAKKANIKYYDLLSVVENSSAKEALKNGDDEESIKRECEKRVDAKISSRDLIIPDTAEALIDGIYSFSNSDGKMSEQEQEELNTIFKAYSTKRDEIDENDVNEDFKLKHKEYDTVLQCPSKSIFFQADEIEQENIRKLFSLALKRGYKSSDYNPEKEFGLNQYQEYKNVEKQLRGKRGQIGILFITIFLMMVPYVFITTKLADSFTLARALLYVKTLMALVALYFGIYFIKIAPLKKKLKLAKEKLQYCYRKCLVKREESLSGYRRMYENDLNNIEKVRYERRDLLKLYLYNQKLNDNVEQHRRQLEKMEESLSTMLNNLGIQPIVDINESSVDGEFDLEKSINSPENGIYKVFSLETIEHLFDKSWEEE